MLLRAIKLIIPLLLFLFAIYTSFITYRATEGKKYPPGMHLIRLSQQFLKHDLALSPYNIPSDDIVDYNGKQYLYFGPLPSIILIPLVLIFKDHFSQIIIGFISLTISLFSVYYIARKYKFSLTDALWLALFFTFSTVLFSTAIINLSAYQVQALGTAFLLLAIAEYFGKRRFFIIGLLVACAGATRLTLFLGMAFFLIEIIRIKLSLKQIVYFIFPIITALIFLGIYNQKRFGSFWESGYQYNVSLKMFPMQFQYSKGIFNIGYLPTNLYALLLKTPDPVLDKKGGYILQFPYFHTDGWGLAIWFTSPLLLYLSKGKQDKYFLSSSITTLLLLVPSLLYFGVGFSQFGYRYALDFLPFLLLLLLSSLKPSLSIGAKLLIIIGVLFNCVYMVSMWNFYPLLGVSF